MVKIFISYSHTDEVQRENLDKHLVMLRREGKVDTWHDRKLLPGSDIDNDKVASRYYSPNPNRKPYPGSPFTVKILG